MRYDHTMTRSSDPFPNRREPGRIYIGELAGIVNRTLNTIRKWEIYEQLPAYLMPKRSKSGWRYWNDKQVFGKRGILAWMKANDMRPGNTLTDPKDEASHINNLHTPKLLKKKDLKDIDQMIRNGRSRTEILIMMYPRTTYTKIEGLEAALVKYYKYHDIYFPPKIRIKTENLSPLALKELKRLQRKVNKLQQGKS
jgi:hypothetical protein